MTFFASAVHCTPLLTNALHTLNTLSLHTCATRHMRCEAHTINARTHTHAGHGLKNLSFLTSKEAPPSLPTYAHTHGHAVQATGKTHSQKSLFREEFTAREEMHFHWSLVGEEAENVKRRGVKPLSLSRSLFLPKTSKNALAHTLHLGNWAFI